MSLPIGGESTKTVSSALLPLVANVLTRVERARERERTRARLAIISGSQYTTKFSASQGLASLLLDPPTPVLISSSIGGIGVIPNLNIGGIITHSDIITPIPVTSQPSALPIPSQAQLLDVLTGTIPIGLATKPVLPQQTLVRRVTILADSANTGVIWIVNNGLSKSGTGFPLVAGAAKDLGDPALVDKKIDLNQVFLVGTNVNDKVNIEYEL